MRISGVEGTALQEFLDQMPFLQIERIDRPSNPYGYDFMVEVNIQGQPRRLLVQIKNNGQPRFARLAAYQLIEQLGNQVDSYGVLVVPYVSPETIGICQEAGIGCLDLVGTRCSRLTLPGK